MVTILPSPRINIPFNIICKKKIDTNAPSSQCHHFREYIYINLRELLVLLHISFETSLLHSLESLSES